MVLWRNWLAHPAHNRGVLRSSRRSTTICICSLIGRATDLYSVGCGFKSCQMLQNERRDIVIQSFSIGYPTPKTIWTKRFSLNAYYAGKHWSKRRQDAEYWHLLTQSASNKIKVVNNPVILTFYFNDGLDISNHAAMAKMIEDGLKGRIIPDDNRKWVKGHEYYFHDKDYILVEIREVEQ